MQRTTRCSKPSAATPGRRDLAPRSARCENIFTQSRIQHVRRTTRHSAMHGVETPGSRPTTRRWAWCTLRLMLEFTRWQCTPRVKKQPHPKREHGGDTSDRAAHQQCVSGELCGSGTATGGKHDDICVCRRKTDDINPCGAHSPTDACRPFRPLPTCARAHSPSALGATLSLPSIHRGSSG